MRSEASAARAVTTISTTRERGRDPLVDGAGPAEEGEDRDGHRRPVGAGDEDGRAELAERDREREAGGDAERPQDERQVDLTPDAGRRGAEHGRGVVQALVDRAQRGRDDPDDEGRRDEGLRDRDEPRRATEVERRVVEGDHEAEAEHDGGRAERKHDEDVEPAGPAPRDRDRREPADDERERGRRRREEQRAEDRPPRLDEEHRRLAPERPVEDEPVPAGPVERALDERRERQRRARGPTARGRRDDPPLAADGPPQPVLLRHERHASLQAALAQAREAEDRRDGAELDEREHGRGAQVEEARRRVVDLRLEGRVRRPAEDEDDAERGEAEEEDERAGRGERRREQRQRHMPEARRGAGAERRGAVPEARVEPRPVRADHADDDGDVEEDVRGEDRGHAAVERRARGRTPRDDDRREHERDEHERAHERRGRGRRSARPRRRGAGRGRARAPSTPPPARP